MIPQFYTNVKSISVVAKRAELRGYGIRKIQKGCLKNEAALEFDSLPAHIQEYLGDPRKAGHILERYYRTDQETIDFYTTYKFPDMNIGLTDKQQERYITNASVLKAVVLLKADRERERITKGYSTTGIFNSLTADSNSFNSVLKKQFDVEHNLPEHPLRFKEALLKFQSAYEISAKEAYTLLIKKYHGNENARIVTDPVINLLNNLFAGTNVKPNPTEIARQYESFLAGYVEVIYTETGEMANSKDFPKLSKGTVTQYLAQWKNKIGNEAKRSGDRQKLIGKFIPHHSLDKSKMAGEIISIDDRQPPFKYSGNSRPWFYLGVDLGSEAWICWVHGTTKEGIIIDFYRQMIRNYHEWGINLPAELECESSLNSSFKNTFLQEGRMFKHVRMEANNARGKEIERYNGRLRYGNEKQRKGWLARPTAKNEANQSGPGDVPRVPYNEIIEGCLGDIEEWNNTPHSVHTDKTRWEVFTEMQHPELKPTNYKAILPTLGYKTETSCNAGIIKLQGQEWLLGDEGKICTGGRLIGLMGRVEGGEVDVYWLDGNDGGVIKALVYIKDLYICEAVAKPTYSRAKISRGAQDDENNMLMSSYAATIQGYQRKRKNSIEKVLVIDETPKTLNNKFQIKGPKRAYTQETRNEREIEILETIDDEVETAEYSNNRSSQFDRF